MSSGLPGRLVNSLGRFSSSLGAEEDGINPPKALHSCSVFLLGKPAAACRPLRGFARGRSLPHTVSCSRPLDPLQLHVSHVGFGACAGCVWGGSPVTPCPSPVPPPCPRHFPGHACVGRSRPAGPLVPPLLSKHIQCKTGFHNFCSDIWEGGTPQHCDLGQSFGLGSRAEAGNRHS